LAVEGRVPRRGENRLVKIFKLEEANALLPVIRPLLQELIRRRRDLAIAMLEADIAGGFGIDKAGSRELTMRRETRELQDELLILIERIQRHGCVVKDVDLGLVDFPALRGGVLVNLCWKIDEPSVAFWHSVDEGFGARKPLTRRRTS
jgi:hypothetical protein